MQPVANLWQHLFDDAVADRSFDIDVAEDGPSRTMPSGGYSDRYRAWGQLPMTTGQLQCGDTNASRA
jgi:hypothetical protein